MVVILETPRLVLRELTMDDLGAVAPIYADPEVVRYIGDGRTATREETEEWLRTALERYRLHGIGHWAAVLKETGEIAGRCGLVVRDVEGSEEREIAYLLARHHWGRGLATEAASAVRDHAIGVLGAHRLVSLIDHGNAASEAVARRVGMSLERDVEWNGKIVSMFALGDRRPLEATPPVQ